MTDIQEARLNLLAAANRAVIAAEKHNAADYETALRELEDARNKHRALVENYV